MAETTPMTYLVLLEQGPLSWGASVPDLPGCVAVGATREEAEQLIHEAIVLHVDGLKQDGLPVPEPTTFAAAVDLGPSART